MTNNTTTLRINHISLAVDQQTRMDFSYAYELNGNVHSISHPGQAGVDSETFAYDDLDRLTSASYGAPVNGHLKMYHFWSFKNVP